MSKFDGETAREMEMDNETRTFPIMFFTVIAFVFGVAAGMAWDHTLFQDDMVARGLASYCPPDGQFAFKGECDD